jgi:hypothetical protein
MTTLNKTTESLMNDLKEANKFKLKISKETVKTTKTASDLGFLYEKARNAIEFRDDHLVRQAAIERILKRRLFLNQESIKISKLLIKELSWARYFTDNSIESSKIEDLTKIIDKYRSILNLSEKKFLDRLVGLCSCEIEENLSFNPLPQILTNYVSSSLLPRLEFGETDKKIKSIQVYIATERAYAKDDEILITYKLLKVLLPKWNDPDKLFTTLTTIEEYLNHPLKDNLKRKITQMIPPFNLIREIIKSGQDMDSLVTDSKLLDGRALRILEKKYSETKDKVLRASKRSIIYIILTKMVLAILIEIPFEVLFSKINYLVLTINILFPPSLMFLFNSRVKLPSSRNSNIMIEKINEYFYKSEDEIVAEHIEATPKAVGKNKIFFYFFLTTSSLVIIGILWFLNLLGFSIVSQFIFLFFLTVVSFFAFRVREISKDYQLSDEYGESFWESLVDYIFLPIIKVGQFLSNQISKLNILSFIFDFIIEAPLKTFLEILEDWLHFVRIKKEEILS